MFIPRGGLQSTPPLARTKGKERVSSVPPCEQKQFGGTAGEESQRTEAVCHRGARHWSRRRRRDPRCRRQEGTPAVKRKRGTLHSYSPTELFATGSWFPKRDFSTGVRSAPVLPPSPLPPFSDHVSRHHKILITPI